jgi:CRISPR-associated endonuclease Cas2
MTAGAQGQYRPLFLSGYRLMWMLVTFDLPVETKKQRAAATRFRNDLLDLGFEMSQFSNYLRFCNGKEQFEAMCAKWKACCRHGAHLHLPVYRPAI